MLNTEQIRGLAEAYALIEQRVGGTEMDRQNAMGWPLRGFVLAVEKLHSLHKSDDSITDLIAERVQSLTPEHMEKDFKTHLNLEQQGTWQVAYYRTVRGIGTKIERKRKEHGLSRAELAEASGVPIRTISDWEARRRSPRSIEQLGKLAEVLNCEVTDLVEYQV